MSWLSAVALVISGTVATLLALAFSAVTVLVLVKAIARVYRVFIEGEERFRGSDQKQPA